VTIFYADENISFALNDALRSYGHVVFTTRDERRLGASDGSQLLYAADRGWIILTHNRADFTMLHDAWHLWAHAWRVDPKHAGIIILEQVEPARHAEVATLTHELCQQTLLLNTLFDWKPTTGWRRSPRWRRR
jgi:hypothetical protein